MTCIIGLVDKDGSIYMGGDSAGVDSSFRLLVRKDKKVFRRGEYLIGYSTSFRMGQLLHYRLHVPNQLPTKMSDLSEFMNTDFVDACRKCFSDYGYSKRECNVETGGEFLVGVRGNLFGIFNDFQVEETTNPYMAVGCASMFALGAMRMMVSCDLWTDTPRKRVVKALEVANYCSAAVCKPFTILTLKADEVSR